MISQLSEKEAYVVGEGQALAIVPTNAFSWFLRAQEILVLSLQSIPQKLSPYSHDDSQIYPHSIRMPNQFLPSKVYENGLTRSSARTGGFSLMYFTAKTMVAAVVS